jgi:hypothetical protein
MNELMKKGRKVKGRERRGMGLSLEKKLSNFFKRSYATLN